jgi:glycosyltransferase involved in cell wall biosynthesis
MKYDVNQFTKLKLTTSVKLNYISVIIPVYSDARGLRDTLDSLQTQTLDKSQYELIVANDGGNEAITKLCRDYQIKVIEIKPNMGSYYARNRAIEISTGEYLAFTDADVKVPAHWLETGIKALQEYDYAASDISIDLSKVKTLTHFYDSNYTFQVGRFLELAHFGPTANLFVKRRVFESIGGFDERLKSGGDLEFGNRVYTVTGFKQGYLKNNGITHPPRGYKEYIKKLHRVSKGQQDLVFFYQSRFNYIKKTIPELLKEIITPSARVKDLYRKPGNKYAYLTLFLFCWWIKALEYFLKVKYLYLLNPKRVGLKDCQVTIIGKEI